MAALIPAVGYARRSTDKQEASIPEQRKQVARYAADNGYELLRWYEDDAVSGDDTANRHQFLRMLASCLSVLRRAYPTAGISAATVHSSGGPHREVGDRP